jgi:hypothetical protein
MVLDHYAGAGCWDQSTRYDPRSGTVAPVAGRPVTTTMEVAS